MEVVIGGAAGLTAAVLCSSLALRTSASLGFVAEVRIHYVATRLTAFWMASLSVKVKRFVMMVNK